MGAIMSHEIGGKLVELLGLPKNTTWVEVRFAANEPIRVKCGYYPEEMKGFVELFDEFELSPKK